MSKKEKLRGARRMAELGYKYVQVWLDARELKLIDKARSLTGTPLATWVRNAAVEKAEQLCKRLGIAE